MLTTSLQSSQQLLRVKTKMRESLVLNVNVPACERNLLDEVHSPTMLSAANSKKTTSSLTTKEVENLKIPTLNILDTLKQSPHVLTS